MPVKRRRRLWLPGQHLRDQCYRLTLFATKSGDWHLASDGWIACVLVFCAVNDVLERVFDVWLRVEMSDYYALDDVTDTWTLGKRISALERSANTGRHVLVNAVEDVHVGTDSASAGLRHQLGEFAVDCADAANVCAQRVRELGDGIVQGAVTAADTNKEGTQVAKQTIALARTVNNTMMTPPTAD